MAVIKVPKEPSRSEIRDLVRYARILGNDIGPISSYKLYRFDATDKVNHDFIKNDIDIVWKEGGIKFDVDTKSTEENNI